MSAPSITPPPARAWRAPSPVEVGQLVCAALALVGLFMIVALPWFLLSVGLIGVVLFWAIEHRSNLASAPRTESDGS